MMLETVAGAGRVQRQALKVAVPFEAVDVRSPESDPAGGTIDERRGHRPVECRRDIAELVLGGHGEPKVCPATTPEGG